MYVQISCNYTKTITKKRNFHFHYTNAVSDTSLLLHSCIVLFLHSSHFCSLVFCHISALSSLRDAKVTDANKAEYVDLRAKYALGSGCASNSSEHEEEALAAGLAEVVRGQ